MIALMMAAALMVSQDWTAELDTGGWDFVDAADDWSVVIYARAARTPNSVWVRMEYQDGIEGYFSDRALHEVDCNQWRTRETTLTAYEGRNLTGESFHIGGSSEWDYPAPGSISDSVMIYQCGDA